MAALTFGHLGALSVKLASHHQLTAVNASRLYFLESPDPVLRSWCNCNSFNPFPCYSRTCLRENVCKFLFHCYTYAHVAVVQGVWCTVRVQRSFPCDEDHGITLNTRMEDGRE
ncbi:hypothetical protein T03_6827 [Trichinella britovi]|uniref:Uncharacterized protein n=1 Tax=Trichinella britovi TaxID=45882 RepID=A0A0V1DJ61_TRIBR|nr:hypothetical protein T03_6827 [Trichinella britovi]